MAVLFIPSAFAVHDVGFQLDGDVSTTPYTVPASPPAPAAAIYDWGGNQTGGDPSVTAASQANAIFKVTDTANGATRPGGATCALAAGCEDVTNNPAIVYHGSVTSNPFGAASFVRDFETNSSCPTTSAIGLISQATTFCTGDDTTYATGSKDTLGIGNGGWQCNHDNNVNSKIDIMNAYSASYFSNGDGTGDHIIYFGLEKNKNNGTNDVGVWLLQGTASCSAPTGHANFTGGHQNKDVLVVSEFSQGGGVSSIKAYQWAAAATGQFAGDGGCIDSHDWPDPNTNAPGVTPAEKGCNGKPIFSSDADCKVAGGTDSLCATTNANCPTATLACGKPWNSTVATPWLTSDATGGVGRNKVVSPDFFEGGINLNKVFQSAGEAAPSCFNTVVPDTRSSNTITATLFDFVAEQLGECNSSTVTTPQDGSGTAIPAGGLTLPADPADASVTVKDSAAVTVTGLNGSFTGSVSFHICGPTDATTPSTQLCDGSTGSSTPACSTLPAISCVGVDVGSKSISSSGTVVSDPVTLTEAGRYCFRAEFTSSTTGVPPSSDNSATECFVVNPRNPTLATQAGAGPVDFGNAVTDTATLGNTVHKKGTGGPTGSDGSINPATLGGDATGQITFTLYKADCSTQATGTGTNPQTVDVTGNGTYGPVSFTPDAPGTYHWVASYNGDSPNTGSASHNSSCDDTAEDVVVRQIPTSVKTKQDWIPNDTATITSSAGNLVSGGSVRFRLYLNSATCSGTAVYDQTVSVAGGTSSKEVSTSNTGTGVGSLRISTDYLDAADSVKGTYSWLVEYTPATTDTAHLASSSACNAEHFSITYTNDKGP